MKFTIANKKIRLHKRVRHYELNPIYTTDEKPIVICIEIFENESAKNKYFAKVYRKEFYTLTPSFTGSNMSISTDEIVVIEDTSYEWSNISAETPEKVIKHVLVKLKKMFEIE